MGHSRPARSPARRALLLLVAVAVPCLAVAAGPAAPRLARQPPERSPEARAIAFLSREVPRWPAENGCYSCHNNGDAARALYTAQAQGYALDPAALRDTTAWLRNPAAWDDNALGLEFADTMLARIQFAGALAEAMRAGAVSDPAPLAAAAARVAADQADDGAWRLDASGSIGSPVTYGTALATWAAVRALRQAAVPALAPAIARAEAWIRGVEVRTVIDASAVVLALGGDADPAAVAQRQRCLALIVEGLAPSGGWGAYLTSAVEPFDTALAVLALQPLVGQPELAASALDAAALRAAVAGGRAFLVDAQLDDGSWLETTRPAGQQSYAQYISTTGWVTLALLATQ